MLNKFEKKTEKFLLNPINLRDVKTAPDLLTPGIKANDWNIPMTKEFLIVISLILFTIKQNLSKIKSIIPKNILVIPIIKIRRSLL